MSSEDDLERLKSIGGWLILVVIVACPLGVGLLAGAGAGWIVFSGILLIGILQTSKRIRETEKEIAEKKRRQLGERENE